ncbi:tripartite tricarboxylate transporter substrate binding protein [Hydrogenoanaerobacterium sp.]|uniref:tripartite tricarboxylate transporter substrate binding protein n=1 Tax=Hydrogenoanaerobacterium sp. TaxID=2953763 RepID=UPI00289ADF6D|nr:tripartite tricarboxylate transporter substrate binding protein [Hydrogenoanaerobacterium sp.]
MRKVAIVCCVILLIIVVCSCGSHAQSPQPAIEYPKKSMELIAPAGSGGGYDLTIRSIAQCLSDTKLVSVPLPVTNMPGGGGVVALTYLDEKKGANDVLAIYSPPLCLINLNSSTELNYRDNTTPIARLITAYGMFAVGKDSPYTTINEVMEALKEDPKSITIGGISAVGSMDHIQFLKTARKAGVTNLDEIKYVGFQDGSAAAQLMGGHVDLISTGISDSIGLVESGDIRALATTADKRVGSGIVGEIPTCVEQGIDATFYNWRGFFGPKDMPKHALEYWEDILKQMVQTQEWEEICEKYGWEMTFLGHDDFVEFLDEVNAEYSVLLDDIGALS